MGKEEPLFVVIVLEGHGIGLNVGLTLSLKYTPVLWVPIKPIRESDVLFDRRCSSSGGSGGGMYLQMIQDGIHIVEMHVQGLEQLVLS